MVDVGLVVGKLENERNERLNKSPANSFDLACPLYLCHDYRVELAELCDVMLPP